MSLEDFVEQIAEGKLYWFRGDRVLTIHEKAQEILKEKRVESQKGRNIQDQV